MTAYTINTAYTATEARKEFSTLCDRVCDNHESILVKRTGKNNKNVVMISAEDYDELLETFHLLDNPTNANRLQEGINAVHSNAPLYDIPNY